MCPFGTSPWTCPRTRPWACIKERVVIPRSTWVARSEKRTSSAARVHHTHGRIMRSFSLSTRAIDYTCMLAPTHHVNVNVVGGASSSPPVAKGSQPTMTNNSKKTEERDTPQLFTCCRAAAPIPTGCVPTYLSSEPT